MGVKRFALPPAADRRQPADTDEARLQLCRVSVTGIRWGAWTTLARERVVREDTLLSLWRLLCPRPSMPPRRRADAACRRRLGRPGPSRRRRGSHRTRWRHVDHDGARSVIAARPVRGMEGRGPSLQRQPAVQRMRRRGEWARCVVRHERLAAPCTAQCRTQTRMPANQLLVCRSRSRLCLRRCACPGLVQWQRLDRCV